MISGDEFYDDDITSGPITAAFEEREHRRLEALALWNRYQRGEITQTVYDLLVSDIDKNDDDLTRTT